MKFKPDNPKKIMASQRMFGRGTGPKIDGADPDGERSDDKAGVIGKVFHAGWKTTFLFSAVATACVYFTYIADSGLSARNFVTVVIFIVIYALMARLMLNLHSRKRRKD